MDAGTKAKEAGALADSAAELLDAGSADRAAVVAQIAQAQALASIAETLTNGTMFVQAP